MPRICIALHIYYVDQARHISRLLDSLAEPFDLVLTHSLDQQDKLDDLVASLGHLPTRIFRTRNQGMDVYPFLLALEAINLDDYRYILKIHTKNRSSEKGKCISDVFLSCLLSNSVWEMIFAQEKDIDLLGPSLMFRSGKDFLYGNEPLMLEIAKPIYSTDSSESIKSFRSKSWGFFIGTMFAVSTRLARTYRERFRPLIHQFESCQGVFRTGGDGTYAHAGERLFGFYAFHEGYNVYGIMPGILSGFSLQVISPSCIQNALEFRVPSAYFCTRWADYTRGLVRKLSLSLDERAGIISAVEWMRRKGLHSLSASDVDTYYFYSDIYGARISNLFSPGQYLARYHDVFRKNKSSFLHYKTSGCREGRVGIVTLNDSKGSELLAREAGLFSDSDYTQNVNQSGALDSFDHYFQIGRYSWPATSSGFSPRRIPLLRKLNKQLHEPILFYLDNLFLPETILAEDLYAKAINHDIRGLEDALTEYEQKFGMTFQTQEAWAYIYLYFKRFRDAINIYKAIDGQVSTRPCRLPVFRSSFLSDKAFTAKINPNSPCFLTSQAVFIDHFNYHSIPKRHKICVYTSLYGKIDVLPDVLEWHSDIDFICFSDIPQGAKGWSYRLVPKEFDSDNLNAKRFKVLPHRYLAEYDYSLFVDANTIIYGDIRRLIVELIHAGIRFAAIEHPQRDDPFIEPAAIFFHRRIPASLIAEQMKAYYMEGMPPTSATIEASFLFRKHAHPNIVMAMEDWWAEILKYTHRDQPSMFYILWKHNLERYGTVLRATSSRDNDVFFKIGHVHGMVSANKPLQAGGDLVRRKRTRLKILFSPRYRLSGSSFMRGYQLSEILKADPWIAKHVEIIYSHEYDCLTDQIVVLTKGALAEIKPHDLECMREKGKIIIADYVDMPLRQDLLSYVDIYSSASIRAHRECVAKGLRSFYIVHHVDPRLRSILPESRAHAKPSIGYIGETVNTYIPAKLSSIVRLVHVDTSSQGDNSWMEKASASGIHYLIRRRRGIDGHKPFLKGFVAAACGAIVIAQRGVGDSDYYLGDYPFSVSKSPSDEELEDIVNDALSSWGTPRYYKALQIMRSVAERSSDSALCWQYRQMLECAMDMLAR